MSVRYWLLTIAVGVFFCWLFLHLFGSVLIAAMLTIWPCSGTAFFGTILTDRARLKAEECRSQPAE
ncbi:hypothetical protein BV96_01237 [Sphingomonas paucimobilis]|nr:hypothetical protein BV96_01237 [Sphingomonas paucimobilis]